MIDNTAMLARDAQPCTCGHRNVSHAYGSVIDGSGIGNGPCGIDRDTRNAATGYLGDPCPCQAFEHDPDAFDSAAPGVTICLADACECHPDGRDGFCDFHTANPDARWIQGVSA